MQIKYGILLKKNKTWYTRFQDTVFNKGFFLASVSLISYNVGDIYIGFISFHFIPFYFVALNPQPYVTLYGWLSDACG